MSDERPQSRPSEASSPAAGELLTVKLFYSFRSPYCYLATERACSLPDMFRVRLEWRFMYPAQGSHEARMGTPEVAYMRRDVLRCAEAQGLEIRLPEFIIQGRLAALGAAFAAEAGRGGEFASAAARAYWIDGRDIDDAEVLGEVADSVALDAGEFSAALSDRRIEGIIRQNRREARELGVFGVPTFVVDNELFWGNDRYDFVVDALTQRGLSLKGF